VTKERELQKVISAANTEHSCSNRFISLTHLNDHLEEAMGYFRGGFARSGKVKQLTPKVPKSEKKKKPTGYSPFLPTII
jgi:hypothetical protein